MVSAEGPDLQMKFGKQTQGPVQMYWLKNRRGFFHPVQGIKLGQPGWELAI